MTKPIEKVIRIGVSACLVGERVRYDGGHKRDPLITDVLGRFVHLVPFCPEMELGLGSPRDTLDLVEGKTGPRLVMEKSRKDYTQQMKQWASVKIEALRCLDLCGCILKSKSPSCALDDARVLDLEGRPAGFLPGLFTTLLQKAHPRLPLIDEIELRNPESLFAFMERVLGVALHSHPSLGSVVVRTSRPSADGGAKP